MSLAGKDTFEVSEFTDRLSDVQDQELMGNSVSATLMNMRETWYTFLRQSDVRNGVYLNRRGQGYPLFDYDESTR